MPARTVVLVAAIGVGVFGLLRGTWAVGGSDSSCYALMAEAIARGRWQPVAPLALDAPWPDASRSFAPGGFIPSPVSPGAASPICTPGFSLLLAPLRAVGGRDAIFYLTPLAGAVLTWLTYVLGRTLSGGLAGALAALIVATSPVLLFQVVQPMNDVTVAALWTAVIAILIGRNRLSGAPVALARVAAAGVVAGLAVLVRPNLAPIALVLAVWVARVHPRTWRAALAFVAAIVPGMLATVAFNAALYGHPLASGYGNAGDLFALRHVPVNAWNYGTALLRTQLGFPLIALAAPFVIDKTQRRAAWLIAAVTAVVLAIYLLYTPFPEWWYLRFFLPVLPLATALAVAVMIASVRRPWGAVIIAAGVMAFTTSTNATHQAAELQRLEHRFRATAELVERRLPANAVFITVWESGSIRYHAGREVIMWDALPADRLDGAIAWLSARGLVPFIVIEEWEEAAFRQRFERHARMGALDWPPRFHIEHQVRIFDPRDRAPYFDGEAIPTQTILSPRR
jgi:hypothetical protein